MMTAPALKQPRTEPIAACPVCGSARAVLQATLPDHLHGVPGIYSYVRCADCRTVYQNPRVIEEDLGYCYPADYFTHRLPEGGTMAENTIVRGAREMLRRSIRHYADGTSGAGLAWWARASGRLLSHIPRLRVRARFGLMDALSTRGALDPKCLEVGPGQGQTLRHLRATGWDAIGLDIDAAAARTAAAVSGCEVKVGTLASVNLPPSSFDLVFMSHVVEHLPDLRASLARAFALLAAGGRLVMLYPNPDSLGACYDPRFSCNWDAPRHLALPPREAMTGLLKDIGFQCVNTRTSARNAACYRNRARKYRAQASRHPFLDETTVGDRAFGFLQSSCVAAGASVGEEILVTALKSDSC